jgi:salicylate hydroxylase
MKCVIAGAGVAGCIVARALARLPGVEVICLEQVGESDHSESGTGLNVGPNAIKALARFDPELHAAVVAASLPWSTWRVSLTDGTVLFDLPLSQVADNDGVRIRWSGLYDVLRRSAAGLIRFGTRITSVSRMPGDADRLTITYEGGDGGGRIDDIDLLVAGDGRYSLTRASLAGAPVMRQHGVVIYRLLVPDTSVGLIDDYEQWFNGPNRLLAFRVPDGGVYIAGTFPIPPGAEVPEEAKDAAFLRRLYTPADRAPSAQCAWLIDQVCANVADIHWARLQESPPLFHDADGHVLYLGDASHGMVPTLGQGATQAIEDACVAAALLREACASGASAIPAALGRYAELRDPRVRFVMDFSREASDTLEAGSDPVAGTRKKTEAPFRAKLERLYRDISEV